MSFEPMQHEFTFDTNDISYRCIAKRSDRHWGHALEVGIFDHSGRLVNCIVFCCHPEQADFNLCQDKSTEQLLDLAAEALRSGIYEEDLALVRPAGLRLYVRFSDLSSP
jgi:hypothetical protein